MNALCATIMRSCITILSFFFLPGCKITEKSIAGSYSLKNVRKTTLELNSDNTFELTKINRDPYLFTSDHSDQHFFISKGTWTFSKRTLTLASSKDSLIYDLVKVQFDTSKKLEYSSFKFYDLYNDSVAIGMVYYPDGSSATCEIEGKDCYSWSEDLRKIDSLDFEFYGYHPWRVISKSKKNGDVTVHLIPEYKTGFYVNAKFKMKRKKIIDTQRHRIFIKIKSGI